MDLDAEETPCHEGSDGDDEPAHRRHERDGQREAPEGVNGGCE